MAKRQAQKQGGIPEANAEQQAALKAAAGSEDLAFNAILVGRTIAAAPVDQDPSFMPELAQMTRIAMTAFAPVDPVEGLLAAQAVGLHHAVMTCLQRATLRSRSPEDAARSWRDAASLSRAMVETMDSLDKWRRRSVSATLV